MAGKRRINETPAIPNETSLSEQFERELGRRIKITKRSLSQADAERLLTSPDTYQLYSNLSRADLAQLTLNLILDDRLFPPVILDDDDNILDGHQRLAAFVAKKGLRQNAQIPARVCHGPSSFHANCGNVAVNQQWSVHLPGSYSCWFGSGRG